MITHLGLSVLAIHGRNKNKNAINDDDDDDNNNNNNNSNNNNNISKNDDDGHSYCNILP